ncbi:hypothetical protein INT46_010894 [Mucor plumbeus]|uniref:Uncharacterized protein n=1 Tax=Mucor plumbeus TaxID=97098 RepID=A0A8H7R443_9FUNG|nr:hypothetical protein INT46_010894 [Mucor plumbeus]
MEIKNKNPQYHFINNKYLQKVTHPTFARFATEKESEIIKRSASVPFETSLQLQNRWINYYNNVITAERPKIQTASRGTNTTATFQRIFIQAKALKNSRAQISAASIVAIGDQAQSSARLLKRDDNTTEESDDESYEEEKNAEDEDRSSEMEERAIEDETSLIAENDEDENYASKIRNMAITKLLDPKYIIDAINIPGKEHNNSIRHILYKKAHSIIQQESIGAISAELLKLSLSNILNFTNPYLQNIYESLIPTGETKKINHIRQQKKDELEFDDNMNIMIDEVLDQLELYTTNFNTDKLRTIIDELKYKEPNKHSPKYQLLNVVEIVVRGFHFWKGASPKSELAYLRKFEELLDVIMDDTELILSDGESVCVSTRDSLRSMMEEDELTEFGRRIDLIVNCSRLGVTVELCSIEFKRQDASKSVVTRQQSKNARINSCILSSINSLTKNFSNQILSFDFVGNNGYMTQMCCYEDVMFSQKITDLHIPTDTFELDSLRSTLKHLYLWKSHLVKLSATVIKSLYSNKRRYSLVETCEKDSNKSSRLSPPPIQLNNIFMTPHRKSTK